MTQDNIQKKKSVGKTIAIVLISLVVAGGLGFGGYYAYKMLNKPIDERLTDIENYVSTGKYDKALTNADKVYDRLAELDVDQKCMLADYYCQIGKNAKMPEATKKYKEIVGKLFKEATALCKGVKSKNAKRICLELYGISDNLSLEDKCKLTVFLAKIATDNWSDRELKEKCALLYDNYANSKEFEKSDIDILALAEEYDVDLADIVSEGRYIAWGKNKSKSKSEYNPETMPNEDMLIPIEDEYIEETPLEVEEKPVQESFYYVLVTGTDVRLRLGPSLESDVLTDDYGYAIHPEKWDRLEYIDEYDDFYCVRYQGRRVWISKLYSEPYYGEIYDESEPYAY